MPCLYLFTQTRAKCFGGKVSVELIYIFFESFEVKFVCKRF